MNNQRIDDLLVRVVALLGRMERDYEEGQDKSDIMDAAIMDIVNLGVDCHEMREEIKKDHARLRDKAQAVVNWWDDDTNNRPGTKQFDALRAELEGNRDT